MKLIRSIVVPCIMVCINEMGDLEITQGRRFDVTKRDYVVVELKSVGKFIKAIAKEAGLQVTITKQSTKKEVD